ncbi:hypothetical protein F5144DRAFT_605891 [Chaetomium tenue]|uniref:Uncharacterized protein n=1 Tax=Chaetomium tenue TaxID=1854479 RepID=A0ACB7P0L2_9PEZI|nr:hypothetical protein F5144DRAFT_605891 [Chaetomium globosum]
MNVMGLASGTTSRYTDDYVLELITRKLGRWFTIGQGARQVDLDDTFQMLAKECIKIDWHLHCSDFMFDFRFRDPSTDKAYGFLYEKSEIMEEDFISYSARDKQGLPVDLVVVPSLGVWGDHSRPAEGGPVHVQSLTKMSVIVDMTIWGQALD